MKDVVLCVPTIRENCFRDFIERWAGVRLFDHVDLIIMEDNPERTFTCPKGIGTEVTHLSWKDIRARLGDKEWIIPRRSDTVRSFGYLLASELGYRYILTLDDDCYPCTEVDGMTYDGAAFVNEHIRQLTGRTRWFNTLNSVKPRGIPFYNVGTRTDTVVNHGLWTNVLDYDAPYQLANPIKERFSFDNRLVPHGAYFPMCGMNVMWKREATVLMYHLLMGQVMTPKVDDTGQPTKGLIKLPFDRMGDIWCGILMKKICDIKGLSVSTGMPYIRHERASNPFTNLKKEANGIEVNERLWEHVDEFRCDPTITLAECYRELGRWIGGYTEFPEHSQYFGDLGDAMVTWAELFIQEQI